MEREPNERGKGGLMIFAACGMVLCCALPILLAGGGLAAAGGLFEGSLGWWLLAGVFVLAAGGLVLRNRSRAGSQFPEMDPRHTGDRGMNEVGQPSTNRAPEAAE